MSSGITIHDQDYKVEIEGYYQNFAEEFDDLAFFLKQDGCDLTPYLFCPNSEESEENIREYFEYDEDVTEEKIIEAINYNKLITTETYYPIAEVLADLFKARHITSTYEEDRFNHGKEALLSDLDELIIAVESKKDSGIKILLDRD